MIRRRLRSILRIVNNERNWFLKVSGQGSNRFLAFARNDGPSFLKSGAKEAVTRHSERREEPHSPSKKEY